MKRYKAIPKNFSTIFELLSFLNRIGVESYRSIKDVFCLRRNIFSKNEVDENGKVIINKRLNPMDHRYSPPEYQVCNYGIDEEKVFIKHSKSEVSIPFSEPFSDKISFSLGTNEFYNKNPHLYPGFIPEAIFDLDFSESKMLEDSIYYKNDFDIIEYLTSLPILKDWMIHENGPIGYDLTVCSLIKYPELKFPDFDFQEYINFKKYGNNYIDHHKKKKDKEANEKWENRIEWSSSHAEAYEANVHGYDLPYFDPYDNNPDYFDRIVEDKLSIKINKIFNNEIFSFYCLNKFDIYKNYKSVFSTSGSIVGNKGSVNYFVASPSTNYDSMFSDSSMQKYFQSFDNDKTEFFKWIEWIRSNKIERLYHDGRVI